MPTADDQLRSHEEQLTEHAITLAIHTEQISALMKSNEAVVGTMNKLIWTTIGGSISVTVSLLGAIITVLAS